MKNFIAIILAAGQGSRLRPLTNNVPKVMININDKTILDRQVEIFRELGAKEIIVVCGYKENNVYNKNITKVINHEYLTTNMVHSLITARNYLNGETIITYGDIIFKKSVIQNLLNDKSEILIPSDLNWESYWRLRNEDPLLDAESFVKLDSKKVKSLGQKAIRIEDIQGQFIGVIKLSSNGIKDILREYDKCLISKECKMNAWQSGRTLKNAFMTDLLNNLAYKNKLSYIEINRGWFEIDTIKDYEIVCKKIRKNQWK